MNLYTFGRLVCLLLCLLSMNIVASSEKADSDVITLQKNKTHTYLLNTRRPKLSLHAELSLPKDEASVPELMFGFYSTKKTKKSKKSKKDKKEQPLDIRMQAKIIISDEECTGEYNTLIQYQKEPGYYKYIQLEENIPWPETIDISLVYVGKKDGLYEYDVTVYEQTHKILSYKKINMVKINSYFSDITLTNLKTK